MIGSVARLIGMVSVQERNSKILISGIHVYNFFHDIQQHFGTSRIVANMFSKATRSYCEFDSFFLIDIDYIVRILRDQKKTRLGKRTYAKIADEIKENTWLGNLEKNLPSIFNLSKIKEIKFDLLEHQAKFIEYFDKVIPRYKLKGMLMAATPGAGKTISSIAVACAYEAENVIIVSPKNAVFRVWEATLRDSMAVKQTHWTYASGQPEPSPDENRWFIYHYEALDKALDLAKRISSKKCVVILDESHNFNDMKSLRTERFVQMCGLMKNSLVVELSGTPMKAMGSEAIPLLKAIDPLFNDNCMERFKKMFGKDAKKATSVLANRLGIIMYKVDKQESKINEPEEHTIKVKVKDAERFTLDHLKIEMKAFIEERTKFYRANKAKFEKDYYEALKEFEKNHLSKLANPDDYKTYRRYVAEFAKYGYDPMSSAPKANFCNNFEKRFIIPVLSSESKRKFRDSKAVVKYVDLKIRGECLGTVLSKARMECNKAVLQALDIASIIDNVEKKTLIFTSYVEVVKACEEKLIGLGYKPVTVFAETNDKLPSIVKQFGSDEDVNPLVATYQSLSTAVPLTMANGIILLNAPFRIHEKEQTVARANRLGQDRTVHVYNVFLDTEDVPNISTRSNDIMEWSREQVNQLMGFKNDIDVGIESYFEDTYTEDYIEENYINTDEIVYENCATLESNLNSILNQMQVNNDLINILGRSVLKGGISTEAFMLKQICFPNTNTLSLENNATKIARTVISLEEETEKAKGYLQSLSDAVKKFSDNVFGFFTKTKEVNKTSVQKAQEMISQIKNSRAGVYDKQIKHIVVKNPAWLMKTEENFSINEYIKSLKWEVDMVNKNVNGLDERYEKLYSQLMGMVNNLSQEPKADLTQTIWELYRELGKFIVYPKVFSKDGKEIFSSNALLGGRFIRYEVPIVGDTDKRIDNYSKVKIQSQPLGKKEFKKEMEVESLSKERAIDVLNLIIKLNQETDKNTSFVNRIKRDTESVSKATTALYERVNPQLPDADKTRLRAQLSMILNVLKLYLSLLKIYIEMIGNATSVGLDYVSESKKVFSSPTTGSLQKQAQT